MDGKREFLEMATSLKLVRRAEIEHEGENIINNIYTDLLPDNGILQQVNLPRTTILKGRKGTGKSTIFQKSIEDMKKIENVITVYIDVKTLFDGATPSISHNLSEEISSEIKKYLIYKNFLFEVIKEASENLHQSIKSQSFIKKMIKTVSGKEQYVENEFEKIKNSVDDVIKDVDTQLYTIINKTENSTNNDKVSAGLKLNLSPEIALQNTIEQENSYKNEFTNTILRYFDIKKCLIDSFLNIRNILGVKYIYMYLDDYSEMDEEAQEIFMDWFVAPLNNISDDFVKFKIATYPNRFYFGKLDNQKVDEINLDFYSALYTYKNISKMEEISINYIKRLIYNRIKIYLPDKTISEYFDIKEDDLFELLFDISLNTPRIIGYVLAYCHATHITLDKKITKAAINMAAQKYFEDVVQQYFETNKFVIQSFNEMASRENLKFLMSKFIEKEVDNDKLVNGEEKRNLPTSHFLVSDKLCKLLDSLELNGYITTYNKVKDKDNNPSTLYAISYGMCQKYGLKYGRPKNTELRQYYLERKFLFNDILQEHFNKSQEIECPKGHHYAFDKLEWLESFGMICPECVKNREFQQCSLKVTNNNILEIIQGYMDNTLGLGDDLEYQILNYLGNNPNQSFKASEIAAELDCTYQLISRRATKLIERELVMINHINLRRYYKISEYGLKELEKRKD